MPHAAIDATISRSQLHRLTAAGYLELVHRGVRRHPGAPRTERQAALAAVLAAGSDAALSHRTAAALWGLLPRAGLIEITVPYAQVRVISGTVVHRSRDLTSNRIVHVDRIPITNPMLTLVDLGAVVSAGVVEDALDRALVARLVTIAGIEQLVDEIARPGRRGVGTMRRILDSRALGANPPESLLESRMARLLRKHGLPAAAYQHVITDEGRFVARVDFAYPEKKIAMEVDGVAIHGSPRALQLDLTRQNRLVTLGWTVLRFTWPDVIRRPKLVAETIRSAL